MVLAESGTGPDGSRGAVMPAGTFGLMRQQKWRVIFPMMATFVRLAFERT